MFRIVQKFTFFFKEHGEIGSEVIEDFEADGEWPWHLSEQGDPRHQIYNQEVRGCQVRIPLFLPQGKIFHELQNWSIYFYLLLIAASASQPAIIALLSFFRIQTIWIVLGRYLFLLLEEEYWRSPFLNQFYWSEFWSRKWNTWKNWEWFCCWTKWRVERKKSDCLITSLFSREWEIEVR